MDTRNILVVELSAIISALTSVSSLDNNREVVSYEGDRESMTLNSSPLSKYLLLVCSYVNLENTERNGILVDCNSIGSVLSIASELMVLIQTTRVQVWIISRE